jgi:hypothetical protein
MCLEEIHMTELNSTEIHSGEAPVEIDHSAAPEQVKTAIRDITLVIAALPALVALFGAKDMKEAVSFISSSGFAPISALLVAAIVGFRQWKARQTYAKFALVERFVPNFIMRKKGEE